MRRKSGRLFIVTACSLHAQHVHVWEQEWTVVSRDDVDDDFHCCELPLAESSDNDETFELLDEYIT